MTNVRIRQKSSNDGLYGQNMYLINNNNNNIIIIIIIIISILFLFLKIKGGLCDDFAR
jgi:hypothetical protein